ncbi:UNVERIFIED_ORG: hypothetical protein B2H93_14715 [Clostridium botulinum]
MNSSTKNLKQENIVRIEVKELFKLALQIEDEITIYNWLKYFNTICDNRRFEISSLINTCKLNGIKKFGQELGKADFVINSDKTITIFL